MSSPTRSGQEAVIVSTARTPLAKSWKGSFNMTHGATLGGHVVAAAIERAGIEPGSVEDVLLGCANPEGATGANIARQAIGVLRHHLDGIRPVGLVDADGACSANAIAVQENHDLPDNFLLRPSGRDALGSYRPNAIDLAQPFRVGFELGHGVEGPS